MQVGFCENCRYIDLMENVVSVCPRCGTEMSFVGLTTDDWNRMNIRDREAFIKERFPTHEDLFGPKELPPEERAEEAFEEIIKTVAEAPDISGDTKEIPDVTRILRKEAEKSEEPVEEKEQDETEEDTEQPEPDKEAPADPDEYDRYVYVCYKCNSVASHSGKQEKYYCPDCGSDMVNVGYSVRQWADLSKDAKRSVTEDAKIMHMVSEIKRDDYGSTPADNTPSIINVVKDPKADY